MKYAEKLKDPRWQKKRLQILERDGWCCQNCCDPENTLHVHHRWYEKGKDPWDYPDECLVTLCEECHENETRDMPNVCVTLIDALKRHFLSGQILDIAAGFYYMPIIHVPEVQAGALNWFLKDKAAMEAVVNVYFERLSKKRKEAQCSQSTSGENATKSA